MLKKVLLLIFIFSFTHTFCVILQNDFNKPFNYSWSISCEGCQPQIKKEGVIGSNESIDLGPIRLTYHGLLKVNGKKFKATPFTKTIVLGQKS